MSELVTTSPSTSEPDLQKLLAAGNFNPSPRFGKYNKYCWWNFGGHEHYKQLAMLCYSGREALLGGGKGSGKSMLMIMLAAQYLDAPGYGALILRKTWSQLSKAGGLIEKAQQVFQPFIKSGEVDWNESKRRLKSQEGGIIQFGHLENEKDRFNYQGDEYHFVGIDQAEMFSMTELMFIRAQQRRLGGSNIPLRYILSANPGGQSHDFLKNRYMVGDPDRIYIHACLEDNPYLDQAEAEESLRALASNEVEYRQLRWGDWDIMASGDILQGAWFADIPGSQIPTPDFQIRAWDVAGTIKQASGKVSDETVGTLIQYDKKSGIFYVTDQQSFRATPMQVENAIEAVMEADETRCKTLTIEEKPPGEAGVDREQRRMKRFCIEGGHSYVMRGSQLSKTDRVQGTCRDPVERALSLSSLAQRGMVKLKTAPWNTKLRLQANTFGQKNVLDDCVDSLSLACNEFTRQLKRDRFVMNRRVESQLGQDLSTGLRQFLRPNRRWH